MFDADNVDLLGDSPDLDAEKIEAITQLSPANAVYKKSARTEHQPISARSDVPPPPPAKHAPVLIIPTGPQLSYPYKNIPLST